LPHVFVNGRRIGGLFDGTPDLILSLEDGWFWELYEKKETDEKEETISSTLSGGE
jgi:hypothetical protein